MKRETKIWMLAGIFCAVVLAFIYGMAITGNVASEERVKIGAAFPLTGYAAVNGEGDAKAVQLAVEELNENGGINGKRVELVLEDYASDKAKTVSTYRKLTEIDRVDVIIGPVWTAFAEVGAPIANNAEVPTIMTSGDASYGTLEGYGNYFFTTWYPVFGGHDELISYTKNSGKKRISIVYDNGSPYSFEMYELFKENAMESGLDVVSEHQLDFGSSDHRTEIAKLRKADPEIIYAPLSSPGILAEFSKQVIELGADDVDVVGVEFAFEKAAGEYYSEWKGDIIFAYPESNSAKEIEFAKRFENRFGVSIETYSSSASNAYDAVMIAAQALSENPRDGKELREKLLALDDYEGVSQRDMSFDENGIVSEPVYVLKKFENGKFVLLE